MDVRCEKCQTVYEFDEAQVGPSGVTVKCTKCGNLFKVKRREAAEAGPRAGYVPPSPSGPIRTTASWAPGSSTSQAPTVQKTAPQKTNEGGQWLVKLALSGEIYRLHDLHTLKQWIFERKITRDDLISKEGNVWKPLVGVPELKALFDSVDANMHDRPRIGHVPPNQVPTRKATRGGEDWETVRDVSLEFSNTVAMPRPNFENSGAKSQPPLDRSGPKLMGDVPVDNDPAFARTGAGPTLNTGAAPHLSAAPLESADSFERKLRRRRRLPKVAVALVLLGGVGYLALFQRELFGRLLGGGKVAQAYAGAREKFLLDTDDTMRQAVSLLEQAHGADESNAKVLAGLAEINATWGFYLREDARGLDIQGPTAEVLVRTLRREAQGHLDEAKRYAADALALAPESLEANRAMADYLRVEGGQSAEVQRYLKRASDLSPEDAEMVYVTGALALREGRPDDARKNLEQATRLFQGQGGKPLLRANFLLAKIHLAAGRKGDARAVLNEILSASPQHERAKALLGKVDAVADAGGQAAPDLGAVAAPVPVAAPVTAVEPEETSAKKGDPPPTAGSTYNALVAQADRLSENGRSDAARKLYEKAIAQNPHGVEAMTGLGYCELDRERYPAAIERFKRALSAAPEYGDAVLGLAESYKMRGDRSQALEQYRRYLRMAPRGPKAEMAHKNVRDLDAGRIPAPSAPQHDAPKTELPRPPPTDDNPAP